MFIETLIEPVLKASIGDDISSYLMDDCSILIENSIFSVTRYLWFRGKQLRSLSLFILETVYAGEIDGLWPTAPIATSSKTKRDFAFFRCDSWACLVDCSHPRNMFATMGFESCPYPWLNDISFEIHHNKYMLSRFWNPLNVRIL